MSRSAPSPSGRGACACASCRRAAAPRWCSSTARGASRGIRSSTRWPSSFTVYAPEHPGHHAGRTRRRSSTRQAVGPRALLRRAAGGARRSSRPRCVGHSFGAMVACEVAALRPGARRPAGADRSDRLLARRRAGRQLDDAGAGRDGGPRLPQSRRRRRPRDVRGARRPGGGSARAHAAHVGDGPDRQVHLADSRQGAEEAHPPRDGADAAGVGRGDRLVPRRLRRRVRAAAPGRAGRDGAGAGHAPHLEQPEATARAVGAFLKT